MGARDECCWELLLSTCCVQYTVSDMKDWLLLQPIQLSCAPIYVKQKEESKREHAGVCAELSINTRFSVGLCIVWLQFAKSYQELRILKKLCFSLSLTHQHASGEKKKDFRLVCLLNIHDSISLKCDIQSVSLVICENLRLMRWRASCSNAIIIHACLSSVIGWDPWFELDPFFLSFLDSSFKYRRKT